MIAGGRTRATSPWTKSRPSWPANADHARALVRAVMPAIGKPRGPCPAGCDRVLDFGIVTPPEARDPDLMAKLDAVAGRVLAR